MAAMDEFGCLDEPEQDQQTEQPQHEQEQQDEQGSEPESEQEDTFGSAGNASDASADAETYGKPDTVELLMPALLVMVAIILGE